MNQVIKSRIEGHTLFPLVTQLVLCRHKVEVTTDAEELHTIVYNLHSLFENSFKNYHSNMRKSDSDTNDVDAQVDLVVKAAITILVTHILEITKQQENMDKMMEKMLADADNDFAMAVSSHLPSSMQPQQGIHSMEPSQFQDTNSLSSSEQALINATQSLEPSCSSNSSFSSSGQNNVNGSSKSSQKGKISKRTKRSNHPPNAAKLLKEWLISHANDPYPSDQEKSMLAEITGLSSLVERVVSVSFQAFSVALRSSVMNTLLSDSVFPWVSALIGEVVSSDS
ncbi:hypothetical protein BKA69DRAFT_1038785 [Paraphysoderma sedebokerense]|nr:hypothetical protein BKA69DRAFT_1038785 [Paraphysoderma sedebokerense]